MSRLAQADSRALTRSRLIDAAERVFAESGFEGASLERIAETAGHTRGALYYNFAGKDELFLAVLKRRSEAEVAAVSELMRLSTDPDGFLAAMRQRATNRRSAKSVLRWIQLSDEFWLYALRNQHARQLLAAHNRTLRDAYAAGIRTVLGNIGVPVPAPVDQLAALILAIDHGLTRQSWLDPDALPEDLFLDMLGLLIRAAQSLTEASGESHADSFKRTRGRASKSH